MIMAKAVAAAAHAGSSFVRPDMPAFAHPSVPQEPSMTRSCRSMNWRSDGIIIILVRGRKDVRLEAKIHELHATDHDKHESDQRKKGKDRFYE